MKSEKGVKGGKGEKKHSGVRIEVGHYVAGELRVPPLRIAFRLDFVFGMTGGEH